MTIIAILAFIGLCAILSKVSKFFTKLGKIFDNIGSKMEHNYYKEHIYSIGTSKNKALRHARKEILDADYEKRIKEEINTLTE